MKKFLVFYLLLLIGCINSKKVYRIDNTSLTKSWFFKKYKPTKTIKIVGYEFEQSRYIIPFDEKDPEINEIYKKNNYHEITTMITFYNLKKDTLYSFPLTDKEMSFFDLKYKEKNSSNKITFFLNLYSNNNRIIAVVDSIK